MKFTADISGYWVEDPIAELKDLSFLTCPTEDGIHELPAFTSDDRRLLLQLEMQAATATMLMLEGPRIVNAGECEVGVDPGETHGIRITREMLLGMMNYVGSIQTQSYPPH